MRYVFMLVAVVALLSVAAPVFATEGPQNFDQPAPFTLVLVPFGSARATYVDRLVDRVEVSDIFPAAAIVRNDTAIVSSPTEYERVEHINR